MKVNPKNYALALFDLIEGKNESQVKELLDNFAKFLIKENQTKNLSKIIRNFEELWNEKEGIIKGKIYSARSLDKEEEKQISEFIKKNFKYQAVELEKKIDKEILGGFILKVKDQILDASVRNTLKNLKNNLVS